MSEKYTTDLPAIPDPDYVYINPEGQKDYLERLESNRDEIPGIFDVFYEAMLEAKQSKDPLEYDHRIEEYFISSDAQAFIDQVAVYDEDGRLNIDQTSAKVAIPYNYDMMSRFALGEITGLPGSGDPTHPIEIHLDQARQYHQVTFGHEIGHFFIRSVKGLDDTRHSEDEEKFCDYFGRRMAMPKDQLEEYILGEKQVDEQALLELMIRFQIDLGDVIIGLMEYGILPSRVAVDTYNGVYPNKDYSEKVSRGIFCLHCSRVGGDYNCPSVNEPTPLFNLTDRAWDVKMQSCIGEDLHKANILSTLTKYYVANEVQLVLFRPGSN